MKQRFQVRQQVKRQLKAISGIVVKVTHDPSQAIAAYSYDVRWDGDPDPESGIPEGYLEPATPLDWMAGNSPEVANNIATRR